MFDQPGNTASWVEDQNPSATARMALKPELQWAFSADKMVPNKTKWCAADTRMLAGALSIVRILCGQFGNLVQDEPNNVGLLKILATLLYFRRCCRARGSD